MSRHMIGNKKKALQLGMPHGTATHRLRKMIMFNLVKKASLDACFRCSRKIETIEELSIEHKTPWMNTENPIELFFDLDNIAFSHLSCNSRDATIPHKGNRKHPSNFAYNRGCRCEPCKGLKSIKNKKYRK